jgi:hypothetical protein
VRNIPPYEAVGHLLLCGAASLVALLPASVVRAAAPATAAEGTPLPAGAALPQWSKPTAPRLPPGARSVRSGDLELLHAPEAFGAFVLRVAGQPMALGLDRPMIGYLSGGEVRWFDLANAAHKQVLVRQREDVLVVTLAADDPEGGRWEFEQQFKPGSIPGALDLTGTIKVNHDRLLAFLPLFALFPGAGTFGPTKGQALFAGLEYLDNEPSSSEADLLGPASKRQVPDSLKITFPLMAVQSGQRYVALTWEPQPWLSALFDSPDRLFGSGGHVMGLLFPGSDGKNRQEGSLLPRLAERLPANQPLVLRATLLGGLAKSVVPAVEQYVALRGLPPLPDAPRDLQRYVALAAGGWLDSKIREGNLFRHAVAGGSFNPGHAADAALWMDWLAGQTRQPDLAARLRDTARSALAPIAPPSLNSAAVGHVRYPAVSLVYGHVAETASAAAQAGRDLLARFQADGSVRYQAQPGGPDYAKTHFANEASGLTARLVMDLLEAAAFSGDRQLLDAGLHHLRAMDRFRQGVPRGAQTWECPLHTPDILASAHLVRAYTLGYELSGDPDFLEQARYWAWTGVPFVYLVNPTSQPIGPYASVPVFGATQWQAPVWLGLPVQWCALVYADALYRLVRHDPKGPWRQLADGITLSGIQQTWPPSDAALQGLLPDSFVLRAQHRNGPAINPATVQACASHLFNLPAYDFWSFRQNGLRLHAPGEIRHPREKPGQVSFEIQTWLKRPYFVLVNGLARQPQIAINGSKVDVSGQHQFLEQDGRLILQLEGPAPVELTF